MSAGSVGERIISRNVPSVHSSPRAVKIPPKKTSRSSERKRAALYRRFLWVTQIVGILIPRSEASSPQERNWSVGNEDDGFTGLRGFGRWQTCLAAAVPFRFKNACSGWLNRSCNKPQQPSRIERNLLRAEHRVFDYQHRRCFFLGGGTRLRSKANVQYHLRIIIVSLIYKWISDLSLRLINATRIGRWPVPSLSNLRAYYKFNRMHSSLLFAHVVIACTVAKSDNV